MQTLLYAQWGDVAGNFGEVAIKFMQRNLQQNEQLYSAGEGLKFTTAALLVYDCLDNE